LDRAGARWVNGVPIWAFDESGIDRPLAPELRKGGPVHLVAGFGPTRVELAEPDVLDVDMRLFVSRLQGLARQHGATLEGARRVRGMRDAAGGVVLETESGELWARWVIDASGLAGARLLDRRRARAAELCLAAQEVRRVIDADAARAWLAEQRAGLCSALTFTGVAGGYSIVNVRLLEAAGGLEVSLLAGSIPAGGRPAGQFLLDRFVAEHAWVGDRLFGGARAIPLRLPDPALALGPVALLGDAAGQVYAAHGSGIAAQLMAADLLGRTLADGRDPWAYNAAWQRRWGGQFAASLLFMRFTAALSSEELARLIDVGLMTKALALPVIEQREALPSILDLPGLTLGALRARSVVARLLPVVRQMVASRLHYRHFPDRPDHAERWHRRLVELAPGLT
jgi:flavin-dependent dehydrogenase